MHSNIDGASATVQHHNDTVLDHLFFDGLVGILPALDGGSLGLQAQEQVGAAGWLHYVGRDCCLPHEQLVLFAPQGRHSEHPSDLRRYQFADLLFQFIQGLLGNELQGVLDNLHQGQLATIHWHCLGVHVQQMHFVLSYTCMYILEEKRRIAILDNLRILLQCIGAEIKECAIIVE